MRHKQGDNEQITMENHQLTKVDNKKKEKKKKNQWRYKITRRQKTNGNSKSLHTNNHPKCKWIEFTNQKAQSG